MAPPEPSHTLWDASLEASGPNITVRLGNREQLIVPAQQVWRTSSGTELGVAPFFVLPRLLSRKEVGQIRELMSGATFDTDKDSVDGQATHELVLERNSRAQEAALLVGKGDVIDRRVKLERQALRERLVAITRRAVDERITPLVRARFPQLCGPNEARACTLCHSFLRMPIRGSNHRATQIGARRPANRSLVPHLGTGRYLPDERRAHEVHFDVQSAVTVVVSLSDFGKEHHRGDCT